LTRTIPIPVEKRQKPKVSIKGKSSRKRELRGRNGAETKRVQNKEKRITSATRAISQGKKEEGVKLVVGKRLETRLHPRLARTREKRGIGKRKVLGVEEFSYPRKEKKV